MSFKNVIVFIQDLSFLLLSTPVAIYLNIQIKNIIALSLPHKLSHHARRYQAICPVPQTFWTFKIKIIDTLKKYSFCDENIASYNCSGKRL